MPILSSERILRRREEIICACEKLYQTKRFKEISLKDIADATTFTRTSIYNYFHNKEEIFLALLEKEYDLWNEELLELMRKKERCEAEEFADYIANSLLHHIQLLKIMSMNHYDMEEHSRLENLTEFKVSYGKTLDTMRMLLARFFPWKSEKEKEGFMLGFFPLMFGLYPYVVVTDKQKKAMEIAEIKPLYTTLYDLVYSTTKQLLK